MNHTAEKRRPFIARQRGMSLVAAVFVIVVLAMLAAFAVRVGAAGEQDVNTELMGARALFAARAGLEFGMNQALAPLGTGLCAAHPLGAPGTSRTFALTQSTLNGFTVTVTFDCTDHATTGGLSYRVFSLVSTATNGNYGTPGYVSRTLTQEVTNAP